MPQQCNIPLTTIRTLVDNINDSLSKSKSLAAIAVSSNLAEFDTEIVSDYLDVIFQFNVECQEFLQELYDYFLKLLSVPTNFYEEKISEVVYPPNNPTYLSLI
jgi:hypothetical protein